MGLFSGSKTVYSGGVVLTPLMEDKPNIIREAILRSILTSSPMSESLTSAHLNGFNSLASRYLSYGKSTYTNKLPEGDKSYGVVNFAAVKGVLDEVLNTSVTVRYAQIGTPNYLRIAAEYCQKYYGWDYSTGAVTSPPSGIGEVLLVGAVSDGLTLTMKFSHNKRSAWVYTVSTAQNSAIGIGSSLHQITIYDYFSVVIPMDISGLVYHVEYTLDSDVANPQKVYIWNYVVNSNVHASLNNVTSFKYESQYYPVVPFRRNRHNLVDSPTDPLYITGNKMLKKIGMTMKDLTTGISTGNSIADVDEAFFIFAINIDTKLPEGKEYLFKYWKQEADENSRLPTGSRTHSTVLPSTAESVNTSTITVSDSEFNVKITYTGIHKYYSKNRVIGAINTVTLVKTILPPGRIVLPPSTNSSMINMGNSFLFGSNDYQRSYITLEKQISATETETIQVFGLEHITKIAGASVLWTVTATLSSGSFFIPLNYDIVNTFSGIDESKILFESMSILIYWTNAQKVKTGGFFGSFFGKILLIVILIVIAIYTGYFDPEMFAASLSAMTVTEIAIYVATSMAISYGLKKLGELGGIFAVIAAVAAMYYFKMGPFAQNSATLAEPTWAESLLNAVNMISTQFNNIVATDLKELMEDTKDFLKNSAIKTEELEAAQDLLDNSLDNSFNIFSILRQGSYFNPEESPTAFFSRSLNTNPGVATLDMTAMYVNISLALPSFNGLNEVTTHNEYVYNG